MDLTIVCVGQIGNLVTEIVSATALTHLNVRQSLFKLSMSPSHSVWLSHIFYVQVMFTV